jgi:hypothetical protein
MLSFMPEAGSFSWSEPHDCVRGGRLVVLQIPMEAVQAF